MFFQRSKDINEDLRDQQNLSIALHHLGHVLKLQEKFRDAEKVLRQSYDLAVKLEDRRGRAIILNSLGQVLCQQKGEEKYQLALMYFRESIKLGEELDEPEHLAKVNTTVGQTLLWHGDLENAAIYILKGFEIDETLRNGAGLSIVTPDLVYTLARLNRQEEAETYCQRALDISPQNQSLLKLKQRLLGGLIFKTGIVKLIKQTKQGKHYGFIKPDDGTRDIYFREDYIKSDSFAALKPGTRVEVDIKQMPKGPCANFLWIIRN